MNTFNELVSEGLSLRDLGSHEIGFTREIALKLLERLKDIQDVVLGGDVYLLKDGKLSVTYDNWYYLRANEESDDEYVANSIVKARKFIEAYTGNGDGTPLFVIVEPKHVLLQK